MIKKVLMTSDGKKVVVNRDKDICLYRAPCNPPNTGLAYTRGADLYMHIARSKNKYFYLYHWSLHQNESSYYELIDEERAQRFFLEKLGGTYWVHPTEREIEKMQETFPELLEETA